MWITYRLRKWDRQHLWLAHCTAVISCQSVSGKFVNSTADKLVATLSLYLRTELNQLDCEMKGHSRDQVKCSQISRRMQHWRNVDIRQTFVTVSNECIEWRVFWLAVCIMSFCDVWWSLLFVCQPVITVLSGTLNPTHSLTHPVITVCVWVHLLHWCHY